MSVYDGAGALCWDRLKQPAYDSGTLKRSVQDFIQAPKFRHVSRMPSKLDRTGLQMMYHIMSATR